MASLEDLDARWLAEARARAQRGHWERDTDAIYAALAARPAATPPPGTPRCPVCHGRPGLIPYRRPDSALPSQAWSCPGCGGAWLPDALVSAGLDPRDLPPAAVAVRQPPATAPGPESPQYPCPACSAAMQRFPAGSAWLDRCESCRATWFEPGELGAVYGAPLAGPGDEHRDESPPGPLDHPGPLLFDLALTVISAWFRFRRP